MRSRPAASASSTTSWRMGTSTMGSIAFGTALVTGKKRVPRPAAGLPAVLSLGATVPRSLLGRALGFLLGFFLLLRLFRLLGWLLLPLGGGRLGRRLLGGLGRLPLRLGFGLGLGLLRRFGRLRLGRR